MVDNKKQRKSTRSFNMEKHVERHFEIEKEEVPVADTPIEKPESLKNGLKGLHMKNYQMPMKQKDRIG